MTYDTNRIEAIIDAHRHRPGATLPILHDIQEAVGYVPEESIPLIADALNLSRAEIYGAVTYYSDFRMQPAGRHIVQVCRGEACQAKGGCDLEEHAKRSLGVDFHETTRDREITLEPVFCLGNCACSPSMRVGDEIFGRVDEVTFDEVIRDLKSNRGAN
jgi:formate dehydrogenase subunit gamma